MKLENDRPGCRLQSTIGRHGALPARWERFFMSLRIIATILLLSASCRAFASVTAAQLSSTGDTFKIRVANFFGSQASLTASSITQVGNTFVIHQDVALICSNPSDPTVASEFQVGPLPAGVYNVTATIDFHDGAPTNIPCFRAPMTETAAFAVGSAIPSLDYLHLASLALALVAIGLKLRR